MKNGVDGPIVHLVRCGEGLDDVYWFDSHNASDFDSNTPYSLLTNARQVTRIGQSYTCMRVITSLLIWFLYSSSLLIMQELTMTEILF